ncbi:PREDICTED: transport [Prunus dulcis]|uniref:PREDICTED: transport n=1 Tax=Prunus dulcis TaxID=3755 RepID=A0A5E4G0H0_PRUDU|nr:PREDICTED: transport [Prunus dulcis]
MDAIDSVVDPLREFSKDSIRLVKRCHKPDRKEFTKVALPDLHPHQQHHCWICLGHVLKLER